MSKVKTARGEDKTDWRKVNSMTDEERERPTSMMLTRRINVLSPFLKAQRQRDRSR